MSGEHREVQEEQRKLEKDLREPLLERTEPEVE
jgi:hypothetical protein